MKTINLGVAFLLELCMLAALAYWGIGAGGTILVKILLGVGAPLLVAVIWGIFMAPQSKQRLTGRSYLVLKLVIFGAATIGLALAGQVVLALLFAVVTVINQYLLIVWKQDTPPEAIAE